jgi:hypothetical protein
MEEFLRRARRSVYCTASFSVCSGAANRGAQAFDRLVPGVKGFQIKAFFKASTSASNVFWAGGWVATFPMASLGDRLLNGGRPLLVLKL